MPALTTANGVEHTKYAATGMYSLATQWNRPVLSVFDKYTVTSDTLAATAELNMGVVPKNARVIGFLFSCDDNDNATTGTIEVGGTSATASGAITDLSAGPVALSIVALDTFSQTPLTADSVVSIQFATGIIVEDVVMTLTTLYVMDK